MRVEIAGGAGGRCYRLLPRAFSPAEKIELTEEE
jgi:hypothetical protein